MEGATLPHDRAMAAAAGEEPHLKEDALGFFGALTIALGSVAPAYSLAAIVGLLAAEVGVQSPAVMLISFIPMLLVAGAYGALNRIDPDCGTTFKWASTALGPVVGWIAGWAILTAGIIVIGALANTAAIYLYSVIGVEPSKLVLVLSTCVIIVAMTAVVLRGIELSAKAQIGLITFQITVLVLFAIVALVKVLAGDAPQGAVDPSVSWLSPFAIDSSGAVTAGLLIGIFAYWGWDSAVSVNEETADGRRQSGRVAIAATVILLSVYLLLTIAIVAWFGATRLGEFEDETAITAMASEMLSTPLAKVVVGAVALSALASTMTTVLPSSRTALSMGRIGAAPRVVARVHRRFQTPDVATVLVGALAVVFYAVLQYTSDSFYAAALSCLGLLIAINYGVNGLACVVYFRRQIFTGARSFLVLGLGPAIGTLIFAYVLGRSVYDFTKSGQDADYWLGWQSPLVLTVGLFVVAAVLMVAHALTSDAGRGFFRRRIESANAVPDPLP